MNRIVDPDPSASVNTPIYSPSLMSWRNRNPVRRRGCEVHCTCVCWPRLQSLCVTFDWELAHDMNGEQCLLGLRMVNNKAEMV